jgi:hypothetical protein
MEEMQWMTGDARLLGPVTQRINVIVGEYTAPSWSRMRSPANSR